MSRKSKTLIIVLALLLVLGGGYAGTLLWKNKAADTERETFSPPMELGNLESSELIRIEVPGITIEKNNGIWELTYLEQGIPPGGIELDQTQIQFMTFSLAQVWTEGVVDEAPPDISAFGLDNPSSRTIITDNAGRTVEYLLGDMTPSRTSYYLMEKGNPGVYSVSVYTAVYMQNFLSIIRNKYLFPTFELTELLLLRIDSGSTPIELRLKETSLQSEPVFHYSTHVLNSPYKSPRGVYNETLNNMVKALNVLAVVDFIDDNPSSLEPYGLDKPVRIFFQTTEKTVELLIGNAVDGKRYAKQAGAPGVFTLGGIDSIINTRAIDLSDRFALLVNIDWVDRLTISGGEQHLAADLRGSGDEAVFSLNGKKTVTSSFRTFYQTVIGLLIDTEIPAGQRPDPNAAGTITIEYQLNTPPDSRASITLIPYNRDFYALWQDGAAEFLIARSQVRKIYEAASAMEYGD